MEILQRPTAPSNAALAPSGSKNEATSAAPSQAAVISLANNVSFAYATLQKTLKRTDALRQSLAVTPWMAGDLGNQKNKSAAAKAFAKALGEQIETVRQFGLLARQEQVASLAVLRSQITQLPTEDAVSLTDKNRDRLAGLSGVIASAKSKMSGTDAPVGITPRSSFDDILDGLQDLIGTIKDDYLDVYANLVKQYADMYSDFNEQIMGLLGNWIDAPGIGSGSDADRIRINVEALGAALDSLIAKYSLPNAGAVLFPPPENGSVSGASLADAQKWLQAMGLPASCLKQLSDGSYCVVMDISPLTSMKETLPAANSAPHSYLAPAKFNAWKSGFDAQQQEMESALQQHTQKYSNANSIHDNVQKTISSTLSALFDMLKAFSAALG